MKKKTQYLTYISLSSLGLIIPLMMLFSIIILIVSHVFSSFWPMPLNYYELKDGSKFLGQEVNRELNQAEDIARIKVKVANKDLNSNDFVWIDLKNILTERPAEDFVVIERMEWGDFYGRIKSLNEGDNIVSTDVAAIASSLDRHIEKSEDNRGRINYLLKHDVEDINIQEERLKIQLKKANLSTEKVQSLNQEMATLAQKLKAIEQDVAEIKLADNKSLVVETVNGETKPIPFSVIIKCYQPNGFSTLEKLQFYISKFVNFTLEDPRESNTEGGIFPAIYGTIALVLIMSVFVTPLGVIAAIYLREYAHQGKFISLIRISVNNLASVPSIVFGVFGMGFFIYFLGGEIDKLFFSEYLPTPTFGTGGILWASLTLSLITLPTIIVATEEGLASIPKNLREASYAMGATKYETTVKIVLPCLIPSILTGMILSVARAAGEVAPLMITGVVKLAPSMPFDSVWPYVHLDRKFMHLGFHIYDMGFQAPNVDAVRGLVYATTFLLLLIVIVLNLLAIVLRNNLKKKYESLSE